MRHLSNHERRNLTPAQRALVNIDPAERVKDLQDPEVGGYTVSAVTGRHATEGVSVAVPGHEETHRTSALNKENIARWAVHPDRIRAITTGVHYGGWADNKSGDSFLDLAKVHPDSEAGRAAARSAAVRDSQFAIYDIGSRTTEYNPVHPDVVSGLPGGGNLEPTPETADYAKDTAPIRTQVGMYQDRRIPRGGFR